MTILDRIIAQKILEVKELKAIYGVRQPKPVKRKSLYESIQKSNTMSVIAEVKRASPSKGDINQKVDPVAQAKQYEEAGATAISVLTDRQFFNGAMADLSEVASAVPELPLLCKDFIIDRVQIDTAVHHGASIILLIAAALKEEQLRNLYGYAKSLGLDVLFEVHNEEEAETALKIRADIIGINNRDLKTFNVDLKVTERVAALIKNENIVVVSESGIRTRKDVAFAEAAGAKAVLVGETLMRSVDIAATMNEIRIPLPKAVR
ncbi:indole-3-glycerol phosphate synthase [Siminovitchia terrae]|uniref:Indole-3-glycerol phosphate synthase n=1 Tax=Siminovitchia terrae TaxID=1914933 RepID=A0ABQ4KTI9_SIMTE|nr:indole-3-glycerol phosphate synthase TrpC [Siminovitchia terrae]GIN95358.1 indole-3-glycerol phosphate synthase [Siminovitchia terrae]